MIRHGLFAIASLAMALPLGATPFTNGSFETNTCASGSQFSGTFTNASNGSTCITGWTVGDGTTDPGSGNVDLVNTYWQAADGTYSIDLDGSSPGSLSQTFDTILGTTYTVTFSLSGNPDGGTTLKTLQVSAPGASQVYTYDTAVEGNSHGNMMYLPETFMFTAAGASSTISFTSEDASNSPWGPVLDNVSVTASSAVPEPATFGLMAGALGFLTLLRRRR